MATSITPSATGSTTPCKNIENEINAQNTRLNEWQKKRLDPLLNDTDSDVNEIQTVRNIIEDINKSLSRLKAEQRKLGCLTSNSSEISMDTQTVISAAPVRRKDARALEIVAMPIPTP